MCDTGYIAFTQAGICINPSGWVTKVFFHRQGFLWQTSFTPAICKGKIVKTSFNVLSFKVNKTGLNCFPIVSGWFMNQLMTGNGITFAWPGKAVMACGNSTKMENCTLTPGACAQDTQLKEEVPWYWVKNKIQLEEALIPPSPSRGPWPMSTCGPGSFGQVQSRACRSLACQGWGTCTSGPTSYMASKEKPQLSFHLIVIRSVNRDSYPATSDTLFNCNLFKKWLF